MVFHCVSWKMSMTSPVCDVGNYVPRGYQVLFAIAIDSKGRAGEALIANVEGALYHVSRDHDGASERASSSAKP